MAPVNIGVDSKRVSAALEAAPRKTGIALLRALKRGTKAAGTHSNRVVAKDMGIKVSDVRKRIRLEPPNARTLTGTLHASLKRIPLIKFAARSTRSGVTYRGKGGRSRRPHAFIATMPSGTGVFKRKEGAGRFPVRQLYGASIGRVFDEHRKEIMARGEAQVLAELDHQLDRIFGAR